MKSPELDVDSTLCVIWFDMSLSTLFNSSMPIVVLVLADVSLSTSAPCSELSSLSMFVTTLEDVLVPADESASEFVSLLAVLSSSEAVLLLAAVSSSEAVLLLAIVSSSEVVLLLAGEYLHSRLYV